MPILKRKHCLHRTGNPEIGQNWRAETDGTASQVGKSTAALVLTSENPSKCDADKTGDSNVNPNPNPNSGNYPNSEMPYYRTRSKRGKKNRGKGRGQTQATAYTDGESSDTDFDLTLDNSLDFLYSQVPPVEIHSPKIDLDPGSPESRIRS